MPIYTVRIPSLRQEALPRNNASLPHLSVTAPGPSTCLKSGPGREISFKSTFLNTQLGLQQGCGVGGKMSDLSKISDSFNIT